MPAPRRRYRIEAGRPEAALVLGPGPAEMRAPAGPELSRMSGALDWAGLQRLAADLHAMRDAIVTTKSEMADLQRSPAGADGMHRAAGELDAVSVAAERATTAILNAVEEIELAANLLRTDPSETGRADATGIILDRVLHLYEACNFQDIAGQRIRKVVTTLKFVEARLDRVIEAWSHEVAGPVGSRLAAVGEAALLGGPSLPGDDGHVSQSDVDAFFS